MKNFLVSAYNLLFSNGIYKVGGALLLTLILIALSGIKGLEWMNMLSYIPFGYIVMVLFVYMVYAWIINPIRSLMKKHSEKHN